MKVSALQLDLVFNDPTRNEKNVEKAIRQAVETDHPDTIVLPEMWNVSFYPSDPRENADKEGAHTKALLSRLSKQYQVNIVGGTVATRYGDRLYNSSYQFNREGTLVHTYHKVHLFSPSGEDQVFTSGNQLGLFELDGIKVGIITCYDLRFVEWVRLMALEDIEVLFVPAAWPHPRVEHWLTLLKARAIENQLFVIGVNSVGSANQLSFCGHSIILNPLGETLAESAEEVKRLTATLDLKQRKEVKEQINVFKDRRPELYTKKQKQ
ncbi:carbon-nitrogen family hydrolase [Marinilactibacillus kalidii]|uniref:carbon-nitrogen family hydrolase n=1 Tax=Marinilactibacillus kalidii TaxID=2820274 RepID=UPI001ABECAE5|nr:carbon-nitrogen family hydrolase [Marinilactibacillus kalidii]